MDVKKAHVVMKTMNKKQFSTNNWTLVNNYEQNYLESGDGVDVSDVEVINNDVYG